MASKIVSNGIAKAKEAVGATGDKKVHQLDQNSLTKSVEQNGDATRLTADFGTLQSNTDGWLRVATDDKIGPMLLEDSFGREKIHRFDHERIPERVVHARGAAAFGKFKLHHSAADVTTAGVLTDTSRETPVFLRFSTVLGSRGSADTVRDVRGFAVKFYTEEGNWDIVGNDIPVFFIQDAMKFPDLVHAAKPEPHNEVPQAQSAHSNFWDFQYLNKESTHMFMWAMSDRGIPRSYRMMQGFGVNTYVLVNAKGEKNFVKFHFTPQLGVHSLVWDEALKLGGQDPDFHRKDLWEAIENKAHPKWNFGIQVIPESQEHNFDFDILDATKVWPEDLVPVRYIGELELNRNPDEYFTETEQVAFCTGHVVPGIGFSDDPLLQGRNFSYFDTQLSRLGINWQELPINRPVCPVMNHNRDGAMRHSITKGTVNYWPNRFSAVPPAQPNEGGYVDYPAKVEGIKTRMLSKKFKDYLSQAQLFYNSLAPHEKSHVAAALSFELDHCEDQVVYQRICERLTEIDYDLATQVATMVGGSVPPRSGVTNHGRKAPGLSQTDFIPKEPTIATRRVAILIADGFDPIAYHGVRAALKAQGAFPYTISSKRSPVQPAGAGEGKNSEDVKPDHHFEGQRSTLFDALFIPGGAKSVDALRNMGRAVHYVREAFGHLKTIGATGEGVSLVQDACQLPGVTFSTSSQVVESYGVVTMRDVTPETFREALNMGKSAKDFLDVYATKLSEHRNYEREMQGLSVMVAY